MGTRTVRQTALALGLALLCLTGCQHDDRARRGSSLLDAKTRTAAKQIKDATTPEAKAAIADEYFEGAPELTKALDDYLQGRKPVK